LSLACTAFFDAPPLAAQSLTGSRAPGFTLADSNSVWRDLVDYRGRWLILVFTKADCPRCGALSQTLGELKTKYGPKIEILAIVNANSGDAARYISENRPAYPIAFGSNQYAAPYFQNSVAGSTPASNAASKSWDMPRWFAIDPLGTIAADWQPSDADTRKWVDQFEPLLQRPIPVPPTRPAAPAPVSSASDDLNKAARAGNLKLVESLIAEGVPVNARNSLGGTPLHDAAWSGEKDVAAYLIKMGADVNARHSEGGSTPLHYAVLTNHPDVVEVLLDHGADLKALYKTSQTALHLAAARGYGRIATLLIAHGAEVNARDETGATALSEAAWTGEAEMVKLLIAKGANASDVNPQTGMTPLHAAASRGYREVAAALVEAGARSDVRDKSGATPLYLALQFQRMDVVDLLIRDKGGNLPKVQTVDVKAVLRDEVLRGQTNVVKMLLERMPPLGSTTLLHDAALKGHLDILELLLAHGAEVDSRNAQGATALHDAALAGQKAAADALLKHGANINVRDSESGATPLHLAASWGRRSVVELLLAHNADANIKDKSGRTPLDLANANAQGEVAQVLKAVLKGTP
jgi:ankyrin repeat protein/peroxiredoxin